MVVTVSGPVRSSRTRRAFLGAGLSLNSIHADLISGRRLRKTVSRRNYVSLITFPMMDSRALHDLQIA